MTRAQLRDKFFLRMGRRSEVSDVTVQDGYLDNGLLDLATRRYSLRSLMVGPIQSLNPTNATESYTIPNDSDGRPLFAIMHIVQHDSDGATSGKGGTNTRRLLPWEGSIELMFDALARRVISDSDAPVRFAMFNSTTFFVYPSPGAVAVSTLTWDIYGYRRPFMGPNPNDAPDLDLEWHYPIALVAAIQAFRDLGDEERAAGVEQELTMWYAQRDSAPRIERRFSRQRGGARPHPSYFNRKTGV